MKRQGSVGKDLQKFAGAFRSGFEGFAKLVAGGEHAPLTHRQYVRISDFVRRLEPDAFSGVLEVLDRYGAPYFPPSAPVEMLKDLPLDCARELLACADHGMIGSGGAGVAAAGTPQTAQAGEEDGVDESLVTREKEAVAARTAKKLSLAKESAPGSGSSLLKNLLIRPVAAGSGAAAGGSGSGGGGDLKSSRQEVAALQRMLENKIRSISDLNQQLASTIVRAQNAEADLNLYKRRTEILVDDSADMAKNLQRLESTVKALKLEKAEITTMLQAAEARAGKAENEVEVQKANLSGGGNGISGVPRQLALEDLKQVLTVANSKVGYVLPHDDDSATMETSVQRNAAMVDQAQVDSLRYMHMWLMDAIQQQEQLRRENATLTKEIDEMKHVQEMTSRAHASREKEHASEVFELGHLREDNNKQAMELARLRQEIADRDESLARMEAMHARLLQANRDYAADQIQFRESMAREFEAAAAVKDDALKRADVAREKVEAAVAECAHQRAQTVSLRDNLKAAHLLTKRVLADGAEQLSASEAKFAASQKQLQEFQASLQAEHADVVDKVKLYLGTVAEQRRKKLKKKGGSLVAGLDFDREDEDGLVVQYYRLTKADLFIKYLLTRHEFKSLSDAHAERNVKEAFDLIKRQFMSPDARSRSSPSALPSSSRTDFGTQGSIAPTPGFGLSGGGISSSDTRSKTIYDHDDSGDSSGILSSYHTSQAPGYDDNGDDDDGGSLLSFDTTSTRQTQQPQQPQQRQTTVPETEMNQNLEETSSLGESADASPALTTADLGESHAPQTLDVDDSVVSV